MESCFACPVSGRLEFDLAENNRDARLAQTETVLLLLPWYAAVTSDLEMTDMV